MKTRNYIKKKLGHIKGYDFFGFKNLRSVATNIRKPIEETDCRGEDYVVCLVCQETFRHTILTHVKRKHAISIASYREYFGIPKEWTMTEEYRNNKVKKMTELQRLGIVGTKESLDKARILGKKWRQDNPLKVKIQALKASRAGDKARKEFFSDPAKFMPNLKKAEAKHRELWRDPDYRIKMMTDKDSPNTKFIKIRRKRSEELSKWFRICPSCGNKFSCPAEGVLKKRRGLRFFKKEDLFCSRECNQLAMKGYSFSDWKKRVKELRKEYKAKK